MTVTFEDDDIRFDQWKEANKKGFVLNAGPRQPPDAA